MENWQLIVEILTAVGTMAAAGFAGWAAYTSRNAAKASAEMVALERDRDVGNREEERLHQARLVTVDCGTAPVADAAGYPIGVDLMLRVTNAGREPIHKVRLKATAGTATWGPRSSAIHPQARPTH
ncbi:hypothetical protein ACX80B_17515 [Arthrobacter monumenti]